MPGIPLMARHNRKVMPITVGLEARARKGACPHQDIKRARVLLVANRGEAGAIRRNGLAGSRLRGQDTGLIDTKLSRSGCRNAAGSYRCGCDHKIRRRRSWFRTGGEVVAAFDAAP